MASTARIVDVPSARLAAVLLELQRATTAAEIHRACLTSLPRVLRTDAHMVARYEEGECRYWRGPPQLQAGLSRHMVEVGAPTPAQDPLVRCSLSSRSPVDARTLPPSERPSSAVYTMMIQLGLSHGLVLAFAGSDESLTVVCLGRRDAHDPFRDNERAALASVVEHVHAALLRAAHPGSRLDAETALVHVLDLLNSLVVVGDAEGRPVAESRGAQLTRGLDHNVSDCLDALVRHNAGQLRSVGHRTVESSALVHPGTGEDGEPPRRLRVRTAVLGTSTATTVSVASFECCARPLTRRELEIAGWVAEGLTNRQIAEQAFVSENTVKQHLKRMFRKLGVHNRAQLVGAARRVLEGTATCQDCARAAAHP
ncbi:LuxR C-terminal-related transcriptional regulator [Streptomyces olindensis]|uniref:helix-turn-helix transcriptional regulator n=1 Tax=Streptomyces olindensis TaxID=358823 RepID=UPI0036740A53